jgi:hypothetical protein
MSPTDAREDRELVVTVTDETDESTPTTRTVPPDEDLATGLVLAVADALDDAPLELSPRLYDLVDVEALERLLTSGRDGTPSGARVRLQLYGCQVTVAAVAAPQEGSVVADPTPNPPEGASPDARASTR